MASHCLETGNRIYTATPEPTEHPCFSPDGHGRAGRIHLAVAAECNISCNYCVRKYDCANESRPGVTSKLIGAEEAIRVVQEAKLSSLGAYLHVAGIAGPGEPLANPETFATLALLKDKFPEMKRCLSSNGLLLPEKLPELLALGLSHITVTLNTLDTPSALQIYGYVRWQGQTLIGRPAVTMLLENQLLGIEQAVRAGLHVKVNTVVIPGINDTRLTVLAREIKQRGVEIHNLLPLIPQGKFALRPAPRPADMHHYRQELGRVLPQMSHCRQCQADAIGLV
ncbi:cyclic pyranopterin phosphate synthase [Acididesulfobacillus acetoxydans]|uniref:Cyclic pyranopterin phosphate synthase n=1 Tax=Acididesulfobacillus acetoxydans TaxID=1561005 RepID=A0A8S0XCE4_9FIRM|nr:radical SAM protein [Acididesulfobacillus acetoxydans]CAA7602346.1 cyclic pyranopterin phosphate synthase [Acididesulfobacillus acetoxydans]CEJ08419.1 FeMo cofactor biosynthesis protein NifB [Acididesulfobacillus acetoxydans]